MGSRQSFLTSIFQRKTGEFLKKYVNIDLGKKNLKNQNVYENIKIHRMNITGLLIKRSPPGK